MKKLIVGLLFSISLFVFSAPAFAQDSVTMPRTVSGNVYLVTCLPPLDCPTRNIPVNGATIELWGTGMDHAQTDVSHSIYKQNGKYEIKFDGKRGIYNLCLKTPYPNGTTKYFIPQYYSFPNETRDPYTVSCMRLNIQTLHTYNRNFYLRQQ